MDQEAAVKHLARLVALCDAAGVAGTGFEKHDLSVDEKDLLRQCAETGEFRIQGADDSPSLWLENKDFEGDWCAFGRNDHAKAAITLSIFEKLCRRGYIQHSGAADFLLTGEGFKAARKERREYLAHLARSRDDGSDANRIALLIIVIIVVIVLIVMTNLP